MQSKLEKLSNALNRFEVKLFTALLLILIAGMAYKTVIMPLQNEKSHYAKMAQENTTALPTLTQLEASLKHQGGGKQVKTSEKSVTAALPKAILFDTEVLRLTPFFNSSGLAVQGLTPAAATVGTPVSGFPISITATGGPNSVIQRSEEDTSELQ